MISSKVRKQIFVTDVQSFAFWPWLKKTPNKPKPVSALNTAALVPANLLRALQWLPLLHFRDGFLGLPEHRSLLTLF